MLTLIPLPFARAAPAETRQNRPYKRRSSRSRRKRHRKGGQKTMSTTLQCNEIDTCTFRNQAQSDDGRAGRPNERASWSTHACAAESTSTMGRAKGKTSVMAYLKRMMSAMRRTMRPKRAQREP